MTERIERLGIQDEIPGLGIHEQEVAFHEFLPYSDLSRWVPEDSIYHNTENSITALRRLDNIRALSFLSAIGPDDPKDVGFVKHHHTRLDHSLVVGMVTEEILRQNGLPQEQINIGIIAGLLHDVATPALGDATKQVDPKNLDEEGFWWETIEKEGQKFVNQYTDRETLDKIIKNEGVLGQVLDIADRITYTMKDLHNVGTMPFKDPELINIHLTKIGNIYKTVGVDQRKKIVLFNDLDLLYSFLLLRASFHTEFYLHPVNQGRDLFIKKLIEPLYSPDDSTKLTPASLRQMTDEDLLRSLGKKYFLDKGYQIWNFFNYLVNWNPLFEKFETEEQAGLKAEELRKNPNFAVVGIKQGRNFNPGTSYNVVDKRGKIMPFSRFNPEKAKVLEQMGESTKGFFVFWADVSEDNPTNNLLRAVLQK